MTQDRIVSWHPDPSVPRFVPPPGTPEKLRYTYFLHYAEGSLMPLLLLKLVFMKIPERVPWPMRPVARLISSGADRALIGPQVANHFEFLESELADRDWFAGPDFTAADVQMSFPLEAANARVGFAGKLPDQEEVFNERLSILFKKLRIVRIVDRKRNALVYLTYSDRLIDGSPKNSITAVAVDTPIPR